MDVATPSPPPNSLSPEELFGSLAPQQLTCRLNAAKTSERVLALCATHAANGRLNAVSASAALASLGRIAESRDGGRRAASRLLADPRAAPVLRCALVLDSLDAQAAAASLASSLRGLSLLGTAPPAWVVEWEALACLLAEAEGGLPARELAAALSAAARLQLLPGERWARASEALLTRLADSDAMEAAELAACAWAIGSRGPCGGGAAAVAARAALVGAAERAADAGALGPREVSNLLWGASSWGEGGWGAGKAACHRRSTWALRLASSVTTQQLAEAQPAQLALVAHALGRLCKEARPRGPQLESVLQALEAASLASMPRLKPRHLGCLLSCAVDVGWRPGGEWRAALEKRALLTLPITLPHQAGTILAKWARLRWTPEHAYLLESLQALADSGLVAAGRRVPSRAVDPTN